MWIMPSLRARLLPILMLLAGSLVAQMEPLEADRPDQTESPAIVPAGWFQLECGWSREEAEENGLSDTKNLLPASLWKIGLCKRVEFRLIIERIELHAAEGDAADQSGILPVKLGGKVSLCEEHGWIPRTSLIAHAGMPWLAHKELQVPEYFGTFRFTMQHTLSDLFSLGYNIGAEQDGESPTAAGVYTLTLGATASDRLGGYVELYGSLTDGSSPDHRFDGGITFRCGPDVLLDASGGFSVSGSHTWFLGLGLSFRVPVFVGRAVAE